ncbi:segregation/condensation protein A, partial [Arthrobacter sp. H14]|uniref:segregation/condensation protein A n=1 Tax=Arthrobacter sp. H14 TaxID=1312959 RepID=UPI00138ABC30
SRYPRLVRLEPQFAALLPELIWRSTPTDLAALAAKALQPKDPLPTEVGLAHLHAPAVSVKEQAGILGEKLKAGQALSFRTLIQDADNTMVVVARFLALLEMFRDAVIAFEQISPLSELKVHWTAAPDESWSSAAISTDFDEQGAAPEEVEQTHE